MNLPNLIIAFYWEKTLDFQIVYIHRPLSPPTKIQLMFWIVSFDGYGLVNLLLQENTNTTAYSLV